MKKSEQAGLIAYPIKNVKIHKGYSGDFVDYDKNADKRKIFVEGYEQAVQNLMDKAKQWFTDNLPSVKAQLLWCEFELFITE